MDNFNKELSNFTGNKLLSIISLKSINFSKKLAEKGKETMKINKEKSFDSVAAIVGLEKWQRTMANLVKRDSNINYFDGLEEAKEWLINQ